MVGAGLGRSPEGSNNAIVALTRQDPIGEPASPWRPAFSTVCSAGSSRPCRSTAWTPSPKTPRSWCSAINWPSFVGRSPGPGSPGGTGRSSPLWRDSWHESAGRRSSSRPDDPALAPAPVRRHWTHAPQSGATAAAKGDHLPHRVPGEEEPSLRVPAHRRGVEEARCHGLQRQRRHRPSTPRASASATPGGPDLGRVPPLPGQGRAGDGLLQRRHRAPPSLLRSVRD
jgi:hypothetical protein